MVSTMTSNRSPERVRSIFVSDVHLGWRHSQVGALHRFLQNYQCEYLYLTGDFIDGWVVSRTKRWAGRFNELLASVLRIAESATEVRYVIGNHDEFLRTHTAFASLGTAVGIDIAEDFLHETADRHTYLITHGDRFDNFDRKSPWYSWATAVFYDVLLRANAVWNYLRRPVHPHRGSLCSRIKKRIRSLESYLVDFENGAARYARERSCDGVICGHSHAPRIKSINGTVFCNAGDWVENCTALIERLDGSMDLVAADGSVIQKQRWFDDESDIHCPPFTSDVDDESVTATAVQTS